MKAIGKNIIVKKIIEKRTVVGGLMATAQDEADIRYKKAQVISPGTDVLNIKENDEIMYDSAAGHSLMIGSESFTVINERDVALVV